MRGLDARYVATRLLRFGLTVWLGLTLMFIIPRLGRTDPTATLLGKLIGAADGVDAGALVAEYRTRFGLDQPVFIQYLQFLWNTVKLDAGVSLSQFPTPVNALILQAAPYTLVLMLTATLASFVIGTIIGALLGWPDTPRWARRILPVTLIFTSLPAFMVGVLLIQLFAQALHWLPFSGAYEPGLTPGWTPEFIGSLFRHALMPWLAVVVVLLGQWALNMRGVLISTAREDYVTLGRAKGLSPARLFFRYGMRNAALPQATALAMALGGIVGGVVVVEAVFVYPGMGTLLYSAIQNNDYTVIQGVSSYLIMGTALAVLLVDLAYPLIDPRVRQGKAAA